MSFGTLFVNCCCQVKIGPYHYFGIFFHFLCSDDHIFLFTKCVLGLACTSSWVTVVLGECSVTCSTWLKYWSEFFYINTWLKYWSKFLLLQSKKCVILGFFPLYLSSQVHRWSLVLGCWKSTKDQLLVIIIGAFSPRSRPSTEKSVKRLFYHDR